MAFPSVTHSPRAGSAVPKPLQYSLSLESSGTEGLRELPRDHTEECVSNLGMELLSPKTLSGSVLTALCQTFFWAFPSQAFTPCPALLLQTQHFNHPQNEQRERRITNGTEPIWGCSLLPPCWQLSLFSSKGSRVCLSLACQHELTFELC